MIKQKKSKQLMNISLIFLFQNFINKARLWIY